METQEAKIFITDRDLQQLKKILPVGRSSGAHIRMLHSRLKHAAVVHAMPPDVVSLGSRFRMRDVESKQEGEYSLVLPNMADLTRGNISVLAPIGAHLLGAQENETITFTTPDSTRYLRIEAVVQQEDEQNGAS